MEIIQKYFPDLSEDKIEKFRSLYNIYKFWNAKVNLISRNDVDNLYERHVLHSLFIAKIKQFKAQDIILDVGTGGGLPGIPLSIMFPEAKFHLVDSIEKKIKVVKNIVNELELSNVTCDNIRVEKVLYKYNYIVSRAVTNFPKFVAISKNKIKQGKENGIFYLKGGDFHNEIKQFEKKIKIYDIKDWFEEEFFKTKKLIFLSV